MPPEDDILDFMLVDRVVELYNQIAAEGPPSLDWKFYGRSKSKTNEEEETEPTTADANEIDAIDNEKNITSNTEFDFDEELNDLPTDTPATNESLQLKKRHEPGQEKKINLSDIMNDMMKEKQLGDS